MILLQPIHTHLKVEALTGPAFQLSSVILEKGAIGEDHYMGLVKLQEIINYFGETRVNQWFPAGEGEDPAAQRRGLGGDVPDPMGLKLRPVCGGRGKQAVAAGLVTAVGKVKPEFLQMLELEHLVTAGVGKGRLPGEALEKAAHLKITVDRRVRPILQDPVAGGVGDEPGGAVTPHVNGNTL
jgi:hypothetical protein